MASYARTWSGDPMVLLMGALQLEGAPLPVEFSPVIEATIVPDPPQQELVVEIDVSPEEYLALMKKLKKLRKKG